MPSRANDYLISVLEKTFFSCEAISNKRISDTDYLAKQESNQAPTAETEHSMFPQTCVNIWPIFSLDVVRLQLDFTNFIGSTASLFFFTGDWQHM